MRQNNEQRRETGKTVFDTTLADFIKLNVFQDINNALNMTPKDCLTCCWKNACRGGPILSRYSHNNGFNNPYKDLKKIYAFVTKYLIENGIPYSTIENNLLSA